MPVGGRFLLVTKAQEKVCEGCSNASLELQQYPIDQQSMIFVGVPLGRAIRSVHCKMILKKESRLKRRNYFLRNLKMR